MYFDSWKLVGLCDMKKLLFILCGILVLSLIYRIFIYNHLSSGYRNPADVGKYAVYRYSLPRTIAFAGEKIPLQDQAVRDRMIHLLIANSYSKTKSLMMHKLSSRWFPMIERSLKKNHVPDDFKYLALVESGFGSEVSSKGAAGFWQFIPSTARHYGLEINDRVDERLDPEKSTIAACKYIKDCYLRFDNWTLAAASYNMGPDALMNQMKIQNEKSYFDLVLNKETSSYLFKILAMKEIITKPGFYGYRFKKNQLYKPLPFKTVVIDSSITNIEAFADYNNTTVALLKYMNPWLLKNELLNPEHKPYRFIIVKPGTEKMPGMEINLPGNEVSDTLK